MHIRVDDLSGSEIRELLEEHLANMRSISPPESTHALSIEGLRQPDVTFWTVWEKGDLLGCGAIKELDAEHGEIKSMRTISQHLRKGVAKALLDFIIDEAGRRGYRRLSLETGSMEAFAPADSFTSARASPIARRLRSTSWTRTASLWQGSFDPPSPRLRRGRHVTHHGGFVCRERVTWDERERLKDEGVLAGGGI